MVRGRNGRVQNAIHLFKTLPCPKREYLSLEGIKKVRQFHSFTYCKKGQLTNGKAQVRKK
jgi:hypothetical protein